MKDFFPYFNALETKSEGFQRAIFSRAYILDFIHTIGPNVLLSFRLIFCDGATPLKKINLILTFRSMYVPRKSFQIMILQFRTMKANR